MAAKSRLAATGSKSLSRLATEGRALPSFVFLAVGELFCTPLPTAFELLFHTLSPSEWRRDSLARSMPASLKSLSGLGRCTGVGGQSLSSCVRPPFDDSLPCPPSITL